MSHLHIVCPYCDAINRLPGDRLDQRPRCGQCQRPLFDGRPVALSAANFERHIDRSDIPVVVDFWAPWCGPCKMMAPAFEQATAQLEPRARLAKLDTEQAPAIAGRYGIRSIPTLIVFKQGRELARQAGAAGADAIISWVKAHG